MLSRDIQFDIHRQCFAVNIVHHIESPKASTTEQRSVHKNDEKVLIQRF